MKPSTCDRCGRHVERPRDKVAALRPYPGPDGGTLCCECWADDEAMAITAAAGNPFAHVPDHVARGWAGGGV